MECSATWIHKLVATGCLKAYIYDTDGMLVECQAEGKRQGQGRYFLVEDIEAYRPAIKRK